MRNSTRTLRRTASTALAAAAAALVWVAVPAAGPAAQAQEAADTAVVAEVSVTVGPDRAALVAEMSDGSRTEIALEGGDVLVAGEARATYTPGGELESAWRDFLRTTVDPGGPDLAAALGRWSPPADADSAAARALTGAVTELASAAGRSDPAPAAGPDTAPGAAADTGTLTDEETRVVPSGRPLDEMRHRLQRLRRSLERVGRGVGSLGEASLVVHDDYEIEAGGTVDGDVALLSGELTIAGDVAGDVLVLDGELVLESGASVEGDVLQVGGSVTNRGGSIGGELVSIGGDEAITREMEESFGEPPAPPGRDDDYREERYGPDRSLGWTIWDNVRDGFSKLSLTLSFFIVLAILGAIPLYFARKELEVTAATVRRSFLRSFLLGLAGQVLFLPALVVLAVGILTVPLIPVFMLAVALAFAGGYVAVAYAVGDLIGERGYERLRRLASGPYRTLLVGLAALQILYVVVSFLDFFGGVTGALYGLTWAGATIVTWIAFTAGFGAVALSYAGTRDDWAGPGGPGGGAAPPVPPADDDTPPPPGPETGGPPPEEARPASGEPGGRTVGEPGGGASGREEEDRRA